MRHRFALRSRRRQVHPVTSRTTDLIGSQKFALGAFCGCVGKHPTARVMQGPNSHTAALLDSAKTVDEWNV